MSDRRYKLLKDGLVGPRSFALRDLTTGDVPKWNATTGMWELDKIAGIAEGTVDQTLLRWDTTANQWEEFASMTVSAGGGNIDIRAIGNGDSFRFRGTSTGGTARTLVEMDPDAAISLYYAGARAFSAQDTYAAIWSTLDNNPYLAFYQDDQSTRNGYIQAHSTLGFVVRNEVHGASVILQSEDSGGVATTLFSASPDGAAELYNDGTRILTTTSNGFDITPSTNTALIADFVATGGGNTVQIGLRTDTAGVRFRVLETTGALQIYQTAADGSTVEDEWARFNRNSSVDLYSDNSVVFKTAPAGIEVWHSSADDPAISLKDVAGTTLASLQHVGALALRLTSVEHGLPIELRGEDSGGVNRAVFRGEPDGSARLYYQGSLRLSTNNNGISIGASTNVSPSSSGDGQLQISGSAYNGYIALDGTGMYVGHNSSSRALFLQVNETSRLRLDQTGYFEILNASASRQLLVQGQALSIYAPSGTASPFLEFRNSSAGRNAFIQAIDAGTFYMRNEVHGGEIQLQTQDSGGSVRTNIRVGGSTAATTVGFHGSAPFGKPTITGSRGGNAALANLLTNLASYGLITDSTTA